MPALRVTIDGNIITTVCTNGYDILSVRISGRLTEESLAYIEVAGGSYPESGESTYLTWIDHLPLQAGQLVTIAYLESGVTSHSGKTIDEFYPKETLNDASNVIKSESEIYSELKAKAKLREKISFKAQLPNGDVCIGQTNPDEYGFGFTVLWNSWRSERSTVILSSYTLESLFEKNNFNIRVNEPIQYGEYVCFELVG